MSAEAEMRAIILHAAEKLGKVPDSRIGAPASSRFMEYRLPDEVLVAAAYAEGVLQLLASYLKVDEKPHLDGSGRERDERGRFLPTGGAS